MHNRKNSPSGTPSIYLTRGNYRGPHLHSKIKGRYHPNSLVQPTSTSNDSSNMKYSSTDNDDVTALPLSSDEESSIHAKSHTTSPKRQIESSIPPPAPKRRKKLQDEPQIEESKINSSFDGQDNLFGMMSSSTQSQTRKQKLKKTYGKKIEGFTHYDQPLPPEVNKPSKGFVQPSVVVSTENISPKPTVSLKIVDTIPGVAKPITSESQPVFQLPNFPEPTSSTSTTLTEIPAIFDLPDSPSRVRRRSASTSSFTSIQSDKDKELEEEPKPNDLEKLLINNCPVCDADIDSSTISDVETKSLLSSLRQQQDFCYKHRRKDAERDWKQRGYPTIDWDHLERSRIQKQIPHLKNVLSRKTSSYYLDQLASKVTESKGNRRLIHNYLHEGIVDVAKQGYYGPKGSRIMVQVVTEKLAQDLKKQLQNIDNKPLRLVGVGPYVSAVLVPELTMRLVMEDLKIRSSIKAREVLDESTEIGLLLNADDDHVDVDEDD